MSLIAESKSYSIEERNIERLANFLKNPPKEVDFSTPKSKEDLEEVFKLRYQRYVQEGIIPENPSGLHLNLELLLPDSKTFLARVEGKLIATISIVKDNPYGMAINDYFGSEIESLRNDGKKLAEVTAFASLPNLNGYRNIPFHLMNFTHRESFLNGITNLVIKVQPKDKSVYQALWGFKGFERVVDYKTTQLMALYNDINENFEAFKKNEQESNREKLAPLFDFIGHNSLFNCQDALPYLSGSEDLFYFLKERTSTWENTPEQKKDKFKKRFQNYNMDLDRLNQ